MTFLKDKLNSGTAPLIPTILSVVGIVSAIFSSMYWNSSASIGAEVKEIRENDTKQGLQINTLETNYANIDKSLTEIKAILIEKNAK